MSSNTKRPKKTSESDKKLSYTFTEDGLSLAQEDKQNKILNLAKMNEKKAAYLSSIDTSRGSVYPYVQKWIIDRDEYPSFSFSGHRYYEYETLFSLLSKQEEFKLINVNYTSWGFSEDEELSADEEPALLGRSNVNQEETQDFRFPSFMVAELTFREKKFLIKLSIEPRRDCSFLGSEEIIRNNKINIACKTDITLLHSQNDSDIAEELMESCSEARIKTQDSKKSTINIVIQTSNGYDLVSYDIKDPKMDLALNYNDDLIPEYEKVIERLNTPKDKGIVMFHGNPGTGKTTLIKHLLSVITKKVIYIPPDLTASISRPEFIAFLMQHSNSILVIEDAENAILSRGEAGGGNQAAVANLLNLSDGILSDALSIQILCTFNADIGKIDQALLRKGRLISKYEFKALKKEKAKKLASQLGFDPDVITEDTKLSEIFSLDEEEYNQDKEIAGFKHYL